ncbi:hypothetical protein BaRGS_00032898 [Batillaria attramentaria]|uniref:Uncharacterized protein n=1 Tax=Batillaria attramentaria TaxID=370345 RepID=A0ABD0JM18_9CAEN
MDTPYPQPSLPSTANISSLVNRPAARPATPLLAAIRGRGKQILLDEYSWKCHFMFLKTTVFCDQKERHLMRLHPFTALRTSHAADCSVVEDTPVYHTRPTITKPLSLLLSLWRAVNRKQNTIGGSDSDPDTRSLMDTEQRSAVPRLMTT